MPVDYSKYSDEELIQIANGGNSSSQSIPNPSKDSALLGFGKGAARGAAQSVGDLLSSAINWPIEGIEKLTGNQFGRAPHPNFTNPNPSSLSESLGQTVGELAGGFALPGGAAFKAAQLANKGYKAFNAGKELNLLQKLPIAMGGGGLEGAAGNEQNRELGAILGGMLGGVGYGIPGAIGEFKSMSSKEISKDVMNKFNNLKQEYGIRFQNAIESGEKAGANKFLKKQTGNIKLLNKDANQKLSYALQKFNENPTLTNAHNAQKDLNKISYKYKNPNSTLQNDIREAAKKEKNTLLAQISQAFENSGASQYGEAYNAAREGYKLDLGPYLRSKSIKNLISGDLRQNKFLDSILKEEKFISKAGRNHPNLLRREKYENIMSYLPLIGKAKDVSKGL